MSFALPNPASGATGQTWVGIYGSYPDPALNLPYRFASVYAPTNAQNGWTVNKLSSRKKMRGLFFRKTTLNPVTGDYDLLGNAAKVGDQVRLEVRVYNESTAQLANNIKVKFQLIPYNSQRDDEVCDPPLNAGLDGGLLCPASARTDISSITVPHLDPLQFTCLDKTDNPAVTQCASPAFLNWDTSSTGFSASSVTEDYRIYVVLEPNGDEKIR